MITLHHLENSRSQRVLWLLEELGIEYEFQCYKRDPKTNLAPPTLKEVHPLGRSPVLTNGDITLAESATIIEHLIENYANSEGPLQPSNPEEKRECSFWMHFAEGSLMPPLVTNMVLRKAKDKVVFPISIFTSKFADGVSDAYFGPNLKTSLQYVEQHLKGRQWFVGDTLTGADFQMIFPLEALVAAGQANSLPAITAYVKRVHQLPAYQRGLEKGGPYAYATSV